MCIEYDVFGVPVALARGVLLPHNTAMPSRIPSRYVMGALRGAGYVVAAFGALLLLVAVLVLLQAQRDETRPAGAAVVLGANGYGGDGAALRQARLEHALDLYQRGVVSRIILTGEPPGAEEGGDIAAGRAFLANRGVPESVLLEGQGITTRENLQAAAERAREGGIGTVLVISDPPHMLRSLKIARDAGLSAYASPAFNSPTSRSFTTALLFVAREAWAYTVYIFAGR
jgi:uncharacterized SAM-binding protein YcdF (DUF218 family)